MEINDSVHKTSSNAAVSQADEEKVKDVEVTEETADDSSSSDMEGRNDSTYGSMSSLEYYVRHNGSNMLYKIPSGLEESNEETVTNDNHRNRVDDFRAYRDYSTVDSLDNIEPLGTFINYEYGGSILYNGLSTIIITLSERRKKPTTSMHSYLNVKVETVNKENRTNIFNEKFNDKSNILPNNSCYNNKKQKTHHDDSTTDGDSNNRMNTYNNPNNNITTTDNDIIRGTINNQNITTIQSRNATNTNGTNETNNVNQIQFGRRTTLPQISGFWTIGMLATFYTLIIGFIVLLFYILLYIYKRV